MRIKSLILLSFVLQTSLAEEKSLELESIDDIELMQEFEKELLEEEELTKTEDEESQDQVEIDEFDQELQKKYKVDQDDAVLEKFEENKKQKENEEKILKQLSAELGDEDLEDLDEFDENDLNTIDLKDEIKTTDKYETLPEKKQKEKELLEQLTEIREQKAKNFIQENETVFKKESRYTIQQLEALKRQLKDIASSPTKYGYIKKGTDIIDIKTNKKYSLPKGITVKAHVLTDFNKYRYLLDKNDNLRYKVYFSEIGNLNDIAELHTKPHYFTKISQPKKVKLWKEEFDYSLRVNLHGGLSINRYTKDIIGDTSDYSPLIRTELGVLTNFNIPIRVGLSGMYESISGSLSSGGKFSTKIFSFGPTLLKENIYKDYHFLFQPKISVFADLAEQRSDETKIYKINDTSALLGIEKSIHSKILGQFNLGLNFQRKWLRSRGKKNGYKINPSVSYDDSFAVSIGHQSDWIW